MLSQPVVSPNALKDAINSSPKHLSKGGPMDSIYKSYVFLIQSGFGYYYTWSPFYNPNGDGSRPPDETSSPERASPVPPASARPPTTSREVPVPSNKALSSHLGPPKNEDQSRKPSKKIHLVRSPFTDLPPVRAMRELAPPQSGFGPVSAAEDPIALWLKLGALDKLEQALLDGYWEQLVGKTSRIPQVSRFLRHVPIVQARIEEIHDSVAHGKLDIVRGLIEHKKFAYCRDQQGATPLHKAVLYSRFNIIGYFLEHFPSTLHARDHQGRTPLHYAAVLEDGADIYNALLDNGADENATDVYGHTPTYYLESDELTIDQLRGGVKRSARHRESHHRNHENRHRHRDSLVKNRSYSAKRAGNRSQVREMIQQGKIEVLEEMVLHGHGDKLLGESSTDPVVQEFLDTVPGYMEQINDVHRAVVRGRLREVQTLISHKSLSLARDVMGFTPLHKAVLYGHFDIVEHLSVNFPQSMGAKDLEGRTPLHLAAGLRDGQKIYDCLIFAGAPANVVDMKGKTPEQYLSHPELLAIEQTVKKNQLANATYLGNTISKLKFLSPNVTKTQTALHDRLLFTSNLLNYERSLADSESSESSPLTPPSPLFEDGNNNFHLSYLRAMVPPTSYRRYSRGRLPPVEIQGEVVTAEKLREWIEDQNVEKLHEAVMSGIADQVAREHPRDEVIQAYLRHDVPNLMKKFEAIHRALQEGNVPELENQLESQDFALARDHFGMTPLHRAVILNNVASVKFLVNRFPETINARDREGRTALHFAAAIARRTGKNGTFRYLVQNGADPRIKDNRSRPAEYYKTHHLPMPSEAALLGSRRKLRSKSEPPMRNGFRSQSMLANQISERITTALQKGSVPLAQELVMEGYGRHLIGRTSWNEELRHYLRQVPTQIVSIENMHRAVENGDLDIVINLSNRDDALLRARDENGYQAIHIAVVNRQPNVVEYIANNYPQYLTAKTLNGRQPLHLAALQKDAEIYRLLVNYGADIRALDARGRTAEYYMRSAGAAKNLATNPGRFYEDHPRRMGAAPLPALGSAFSRKSMPDVNRAGRDTRTRTNSESSVVSDQDDHQTEDDKDDAGDEELDSGIQSEKEKTLDDEHVNALENFARASAQELIEETAREFAEMRRSSAKNYTNATEDDSDDSDEDDERARREKSSSGNNERDEVEANEETNASPTSVEAPEDEVDNEAENSDHFSTEENGANEDSQDRGLAEGSEGENSEIEEDLEVPEEATEQNFGGKQATGDDGGGTERDGSEGSLPIDEADTEPRESIDDPPNAADEVRPTDESADENDANVVSEVGESYSEVKEFIKGTLPEQQRTPAEGEKESTRPPLTPQNSLAAEANSADNFERSLSAIPEAASPAPNTELRYDDEANDGTPAEELDNSKNSDPTESEAGTDDTHHENSKSFGDGSERSTRSAQSDQVQERRSTEPMESKEEPIDGSEVAENQTKKQDVSGSAKHNGGEAGTEPDDSASGAVDQDISDAAKIEGEPDEEQEEADGAKSRDASANSENENAKLTNGNGVDHETVAENRDEPNDPKADETSEVQVGASKEDASATPADIPNAQEESSTEDKSTVQSDVPEVDSGKRTGTVKGDPGGEETRQIDSESSGPEKTLEKGTGDEDAGNQAPNAERKTSLEEEGSQSAANGVATSDSENGVTNGNNDATRKGDAAQNTGETNGVQETEKDAIGDTTTAEDSAGEDPKLQPTAGAAKEDAPEPAEISAEEQQRSDQTTNVADDDRSNALETEPNANGLEPSSGIQELGGRAASEAFIENAALEATKTPIEEKATKVRSKSKKRKQAARMKAAMDRLNELIDYWIKEEDLLRLEHVVIAGQGDRLVGKTSPNPQVQEFLSLVPTYMEKIRQVHQAVIKGDVKEVKELLTRKRFALSRDVNGASPLHLSILYGHPEVLKYIVEFFPETLDGPDNEGRTPLHYAAVAPVIDVNFYEVLKQAGADINIKDKNGNSADFYRTHPGVLTIEDIFRNYQSSPDEEVATFEPEKPAAIEPQSPQKPPSSMTDVKQEVRETVTNMIRELNLEERGYVEGSGVEAVLVDALIVVCAKRPSTPVSFLGDYLLSVSHATPREVSTPSANDSSVKTESFKAEVTKVNSMSTAKSTATSVSESESKSKPEKTALPVAKQDSNEMKTTSTPVRALSPVAPSPKTAAPSITVPDAIEVPKVEAVPSEVGASEKPSNITIEKAAQPDQTPSDVVMSSAPPKIQPPSMPSPAKLTPIPEGPKLAKEPSVPAVPAGPPLVAPMQPLGTAPMSAMSESPVQGGILKQSKPSTIIYKNDLFEDDER